MKPFAECRVALVVTAIAVWLGAVGPGTASEPATPAPIGPSDGPLTLYVPTPHPEDATDAMIIGVGADAIADASCLPRWFAGASGLVMTRTIPSGATTSVIPGSGAQLSTSDASATWPGGVDLFVGRWFGDRQQHGVEGIYWGVYGIGSTASVVDASNRLDGIPVVDPSITIGPGGSAAESFLSDSRSQKISRNDLINNVEINWLFAPYGRGAFNGLKDRRFTFVWLAGFRFFEVQDVLSFTSLSGSVPAGATFGYNGGADQVKLAVATNNNLFGGQVGTKMDWHVTRTVRLSAVPKIMLAGNSVTNTSTLVSGNGTDAVFVSGDPVDVHSTASVFSWLGSVDAAVTYDITRAWSLWIGYRVVGANGIAQSDQPWPSSITSPSSLSVIHATGSTIVHGGFAGFEGRF